MPGDKPPITIVPDAPAENIRVALSGLPDVLHAAATLLTVAEQARYGEPLIGLLERATRVLQCTSRAPELLAFWQSRTPGSPRSASRYRWELSHRIGVSLPDYAGQPEVWPSFRGRERRGRGDPFDVEELLLLPMILTENAELLIELSDDDDVATDAQALLAESTPLLRRDFARHVQMLDPWADTFTLWCLTRQPRALALFHPIAVAIAASYAAECTGPVLGAGFPFHQKPLVSASAHLASALVTLGSDLDLAATLVEYVRAAQRASGGWGDAEEPEDVLTTLAAADLLARVDPSFDHSAILSYFATCQAADGMWRALGPDAPWLTYQIVLWSAATTRSFARRFRWPHRSDATRDQKTGLPSFAYFIELADLLGKVPGLRDAQTEVAFIDLIGFRAFNNQFGQSMGDEVLGALAAQLLELENARAIRDGGDEFLIVGAPTSAQLRHSLERFRQAWPDHFARAFGADVPTVTPRILLGRTRGASLRRARETLGRGIAELKLLDAVDPRTGVLVDAGDL